MSTVEQFKEKGYCLVKNAVSKDLVDLATQYALFDEMQDFSPDPSQVVGAHAKYGDPMMESLLLKLHPTMEKATGLKLIPTYSFYRVYRNGDELTPHKDRPSCEISCTLSLNYSYENTDFSWPIYMDGSAVHLKPGDIVVYRGIDKEHWREKLEHKEEVWHVQAFLHYVDANGPHKDWAYDTRPSIGAPSYTKTKGVAVNNGLVKQESPQLPSYIEFVK